MPANATTAAKMVTGNESTPIPPGSPASDLLLIAGRVIARTATGGNASDGAFAVFGDATTLRPGLNSSRHFSLVDLHVESPFSFVSCGDRSLTGPVNSNRCYRCGRAGHLERACTEAGGARRSASPHAARSPSPRRRSSRTPSRSPSPSRDVNGTTGEMDTVTDTVAETEAEPAVQEGDKGAEPAEPAEPAAP